MNYYTTIKFNRVLRRADTIEYFINHPIPKRVSNQLSNKNINIDIVPYQNWRDDGLKNIPQQKLMKWSYYIYKI